MAVPRKGKPTTFSIGDMSTASLNDLCQRNHIWRLALFGSALRGRLRPKSDLDVLVEFEPGYTPGLAFFAIQEELSELLKRRVDLHTYPSLSRYFRDQVRSEARDIYTAS